MSARLQAAACANGHASLRCDLVIESKAHTLSALGKSAGFERQGGHDRERVVQLEHVNVFGAYLRHFIGTFGRLIRSRQKQWIFSRMHGNRIRGRCGACDEDARLSIQRGDLCCRDKHNRRGSISGWGCIQKIDRRGDHGRFFKLIDSDLLVQARERIMHRVRMGIDRKGREIRMFPAILVHVAPHDQCVDADEGNALFHLVIGIGSRGERGSHIVTGFIGHLFNADHQRRIHIAGCHRHQPGAQPCRPRGTGSFHFDRFLPPESDPV